MAGSSHGHYMPVVTTPSMVTIGAHTASPRQSREGLCNADLPERHAQHVGFHVDREELSLFTLTVVISFLLFVASLLLSSVNLVL